MTKHYRVLTDLLHRGRHVKAGAVIELTEEQAKVVAFAIQPADQPYVEQTTTIVEQTEPVEPEHAEQPQGEDGEEETTITEG